MGILDRFTKPPAPATDYQLDDGCGVYVDPQSGAALAGQVVHSPAGAFVAPIGQHRKTMVLLAIAAICGIPIVFVIGVMILFTLSQPPEPYQGE